MPGYHHEMIEENIPLPARFFISEVQNGIVPAHWHEYLEILYMIKGELTAVIQAETFQLLPGNLMIINSLDIHMTEIKGEAKYILIQIAADKLRSFLPDFDNIHFTTLIYPDERCENNQRLFSLLASMLAEYEEQRGGYQLLISAHLYEILYYLYHDYSTKTISLSLPAPHRDFARVTRIIDWIEENYRMPLTLSQAADFLGISKEYFCRIFKTHTGQSFLEYLNTVRIVHLYEELCKADESIPVLMEQNGLNNYKVFIRIFKKLYGKTPSQIRKDMLLKLQDPAATAS